MENSTIPIPLEQTLTDLEKQVLQLTVDGHTINEIGTHLNMNRLKVELFLHTLLKKFNASNKLHLVRLALEYGIVN